MFWGSLRRKHSVPEQMTARAYEVSLSVENIATIAKENYSSTEEESSSIEKINELL